MFVLFAGISSATKCTADTIPTVDTLPANSFKRFLALPLAIRSPETDWGFGGAFAYFFKTRLKESMLRSSDINFIALYTLKNQLLLNLGGTVYFPHEKNILRFQVSHSYYPDKFWGVGNAAPDSAKESYRIKQYFINPQILTKIVGDFYVGATYEFQHVYEFEYLANGVFDKQAIVGRKGGNTSGVGALITWDRRNSAFSPDSGFFAEANFTAFSKSVGSDFNFSTLKLDLRKYFRVTATTVLTVQGVAQLNGGTAPIRNLSFLGGSEMMRGYYKGRYADNNLMACQLEVRQHFIGRFGGVGFVSAGEVSHQFNDFATDALRYAFGGGLRIMLKKSEKLNLRIDYGLGKHTNGLYVVVKEAF